MSMRLSELISKYQLEIKISRIKQGDRNIYIGTVRNRYGDAYKTYKGRQRAPTKINVLKHMIKEGRDWKSPIERWLPHIGAYESTLELQIQWEELRNITLQLSKMTEENWKNTYF